MTEITSAQNQKIKYVRSLSAKKTRDKEGAYTVEGIKSVRDALRSDREIEFIFVSASFNFEQAAIPENIPVFCVKDDIFDKISDTVTPQGILAVIKINDCVFTPKPDKMYIYLDGISDPGNLGTIIRTADAAGFGGIMMSKDCADLYNPKTVRSSMGSFFNIDIMRGIGADKLAAYKENGFTLFGGALSDDCISYTDADMKKPFILIIGNEANGIRGEVLKICRHIKIPIIGSAESLNAGVAAAILMYEAVRQRS